MTPAESVVYWTEYVVRHKGAPHLKSLAFDVTWYQYYTLDVITAILATVLVTVYIVGKTLQTCICKLCRYSVYEKSNFVLFSNYHETKTNL